MIAVTLGTAKKKCLVIVACDFAAAINHLTTFTEAFRWSFFNLRVLLSAVITVGFGVASFFRWAGTY